MLADPGIVAILEKNNFTSADAVTLILDLNNARSDYRRLVAEDWCQKHVTGRWRRRIQERRGMALLDQVIFEFEAAIDAEGLRSLIAAKGW
jgi:hypothetical protein